MPAAKGDALKTLTTANSADNSKTELSEEELAGLSALMAMLPHQQTSTPVTAKGAGSEGLKATSAPPPRRLRKTARLHTHWAAP